MNGFGDYPSETPITLTDNSFDCSICPVCKSNGSGGEKENPTDGNTQVVIVKVGEGVGSAEIKPRYSTVFKLYEQQEEKERLVQLTALTSGSAPAAAARSTPHWMKAPCPRHCPKVPS